MQASSWSMQKNARILELKRKQSSRGYVREETLFSYLSRVARANCFADVRDFLEYGLCLERTDRKVRRDCCEIGVEDSVFYKGDGDLIRDSGLFDILGPFCSRGYISSIVRQLNYRDRPDSEKLLIPPVPSMMSKPKICPKCLEEHRNLTDVIFFRIHQIPGIKVCPIHGCPLLEYDGEPGHELELDRYSVITGTTEEDLKDASFIAGIMERNPDTSLDLVTAAARNRLSGRYPTSLIMNVAGFVEKDPVFARAMAVNSSALTTFLTKNRKRQIPSETLIPFLRILFQDDVDAFIEETKDPLEAETEDRFMEAVAPRYRLLSDYSGGLVFLEDTETGYRFHTTPHTVLTGWPMPEKGLVLDADELMPILVRNNIPKRFVLDSGFKGWYMKLDLKDLEQGGFRSVRIRTIQIEDILEYISNETMVVVKDTGDGVFDIDSLPKNEKLRYEVKKSLVDRIKKMFGPSYAELERGIGLNLLTDLCNEFSMSAATV